MDNRTYVELALNGVLQNVEFAFTKNAKQNLIESPQTLISFKIAYPPH